MKALADVVLELPGLCPAAASLAALTRPDAAAAWSAVRTDPGAVLLVLRQSDPQTTQLPTSFLESLTSDALLRAGHDHLQHSQIGYVDWRQPAIARVWRCAIRQAAVAEALAQRLDRPTAAAWVAGLLAPLGWLAATAANPERVAAAIATLDDSHGGKIQHIDHPALCRRFSRAWRLPAWLSAIIGNLGLHPDLAQRLGADPALFRLAQLAVLALERRGEGLHLPVAATLPELLQELRVTEEQLDACLEAGLGAEATAPDFQPPSSQPLLLDVYRLAIENRTHVERGWLERLNQDLDRLQETLEVQFAQEQTRLQQQKMSALGELAAGAGHEINNPLAVISGQAQYLLKQLQAAEEQLVEDPSPGLYLETIKPKFAKALQTIVGQSQRIHQVLLDLMHFARPQPPRMQVVPVAKLLADVTASLRTLAEERQVRVVCPETAGNLALCVDPGQLRTALGNLLRNAIEAAPVEGWASLRVEREPDGGLTFVIEDNGTGLSAAARLHLFDPFFSGRAAGRGRGMGLPTAWRLARQHGGDVRFDPAAQGVTRFVLCLPADLVETTQPGNATNGNGNGHAAPAVAGRIGAAEAKLAVRN